MPSEQRRDPGSWWLWPYPYITGGVASGEKLAAIALAETLGSPRRTARDPQRGSTDDQRLPSAEAAAAPVLARASGLRSPVSGRVLWPHHVSSAVHITTCCDSLQLRLGGAVLRGHL